MRDADRHDLIQHLMLETTPRSAERASGAAADLSVLVVAALLAAATDDLLADALQLATATADRQMVAIAAAYVAGAQDRVEALAGDHLLDHPSTPVLAWIVAHNRSATTHPTEHPTEEPNP